MNFLLPRKIQENLVKRFVFTKLYCQIFHSRLQVKTALKIREFWPYSRRSLYLFVSLLDLCLIILVLTYGIQSTPQFLKPLISPIVPLHPITETKSTKEIFGFAPFWTFDKLDKVDFQTLTTFAYFGVDVLSDGSLDTEGPGYQTFKSKRATNIFKKAHAYNTRVVLTITQMDNDVILALMDNLEAQERAIQSTVEEVQKRGIDGINIDFEYSGNPGAEYRAKFSQFVNSLSQRMHAANPHSHVTASVYASAVKEPKIYDISELSRSTDGIFMMAYDFAVASSDNAIPTAPLYGHQGGKYWYDISTAVDDFLAVMPAEKLILGVPWYGYNYPVAEPTVKAETGWGRGKAQTYSIVQNEVNEAMEGITEFKSGWDELGKVAWRAYKVAETDSWRMVFLDDTRSLNEKYEFVKTKQLGGVGMWALGFEDGRDELWTQLKDKFGAQLAKNHQVQEVLAIDEN